MLEGIRKLQESVEEFIRKEKISITVETSNILEKTPLRFRVDDPVSILKGRLDGLIEGEKKRAKGGDRGKEDDLLNMSNLGMTLLNVSLDGTATARDILIANDSQNLLADLYPSHKGNTLNDLSIADTPNPENMNDDLLDFDGMYKSDSKSAQGRSSYKSSQRPVDPSEQMSFKKPPGIPISSIRSSVTPQIQILSNQKTAIIPQQQTVQLPKTRAPEYASKTPVRPIAQNRPSSASSQNSSMEKQTGMDGNSGSEYGGRSLRSPTVHSTAESGSVSSYSSGMTQSKSYQTYNSLEKGTAKTEGGRPANGGSALIPADAFLTPQAKLILKNKVSHQTISQKYHSHLFQLMDGKSKTYDFSDSQMGDSGVHFIWKYLKAGMELDILKLDKCKITDAGLSILLHALSVAKVDKLYLRDNLITKEGIDLLLQFVKVYKHIHLLNLQGNQVEKNLLSSYIKEFSDQRVVFMLY